ncbi:MAG: helix-turn-helix transcriptional regulator [Ruminococcaceae bacterium]|nr:helix-turn-helix transcriptional regulator [Oscillospiraceae bacterium]
MLDMNLVIANNILMRLKEQNKKQVDLADGIGISKQIVSKMLNGSRSINAIELRKIAAYLGVTMDALARLPEIPQDNNIVHAFMGRVTSEGGKNALAIADKLSDMILFHAKVRANGTQMMQPWEG